MAYGGAPTTSSSDRLRLRVGDTGTTALLSDAEVTFLLAQRTDEYLAAADGARALAAKYANQVDTGNMSLSVSAGQRIAHYHQLAATLEAQAAALAPPRVFAGGQSISDKTSLAEDTDAVQPDIERGANDYSARPQRGSYQDLPQ